MRSWPDRSATRPADTVICGSDPWQQKTVTDLVLETTLRASGRPKNQVNEA
jgi:hypothetical protein